MIIITILSQAAYVLGAFGILGGIVLFFIERPGRKHMGLYVMGVGFLIIGAGIWVEKREERTADAFLTAWQAASADYPEGRMNTRELYDFLDLDRLPPINPYLAQHLRLLERSPAKSVGKENMESVSTKVFLADVRVHSGEGDIDFDARMRIWVAQDNNLVAKFMFEGVVFD